MSIEFSLVRKAPARAELHFVPVFSDDTADKPGPFDWDVLEARGFDGKVGQVQIVGGGDGPILAAMGMGARESVTADDFRTAGAAVARASRRAAKVASSVLDAVPDGLSNVECAQAHAEGVVLGAYGYHNQKSDPSPTKLKAVSVVGTGGAKVTAALELGRTIAEAVCLARDLVNEPGGSLTPAKFAEIANRIAKREKLQIKILDLAAIKKARLGGLLGVNRGSTQQPRFVEMTYRPKGKAKGFIALVGKGITFDAGGLSIKTGSGMMTMKCDMGGAAAVVATMSAVAAMAPACRVTAYVPMTDNMLGGDATRPGDVLTIRNGKTVEVLNTDAEGRLVLADALSLASEAKPDAIIDLATLTGAVMVALGPKYAGLMGNNDDLIAQIQAAGESASEKLWHLPLPSEYRSMLDSPVADLKNIGGAHGGSLTAGIFLSEFVAEGIPWAHLDIAGAAWTDSGSTMTTKGGTGYGVRLLLDVIANFSPPSSND